MLKSYLLPPNLKKKLSLKEARPTPKPTRRPQKLKATIVVGSKVEGLMIFLISSSEESNLKKQQTESAIMETQRKMENSSDKLYKGKKKIAGSQIII